MTVSLALIQRFGPLKSTTEEQFEAIAPHIRVENAPKGTFLIKRGKPLDGATYLIEGRVDLVDASFNSESVEGGSERGNRALAEISPSDVSAMAKTPVEILKVDTQAFDILESWTDGDAEETLALSGLASVPSLESAQEGTDDWMSSLLDSPLFAQVPPAQLQQLFATFEAVEVSAGDVIIEESSEGDYFYVIESGRARVSTQFDGEVATLGPGQFFGEEALVGETIRNASVEMDTAGILMRLDKSHFKALLQEPLIRYLNGEELHRRVLEGGTWSIIDVRIPVEHRLGHVTDSTNIPLASLRKRLTGLDREAIYVLTDDAGKRSEVAAHLMCQAGLTTYILEDSDQHYTG